VLVGTPGRICDLVTREIRGKSLIDPAGICTVVLDEADKLMGCKFYPQIERIVNAVDRDRDDNLQLAIFSATFSEESLEQARTLCVPGRFKHGWDTDPRRPYEVLVPVEELTLNGIEQYYYELETTPRDSFNDKVIFITTLNEIRVIPQCIIYVNTQDAAQRLSQALCEQGLETKCIYGKMPPVDRLRISSEFRRGSIRVLVATDLLSRGFDVQQVSLVINFDLPHVVNNGVVDDEAMAEYLHRIGRSGRYGRKGLAINIVAGARDKHRIEKIKSFYSVSIEPVREKDIMSGELY
jgi:translation initiation factor 4A